MSIVVHKIFHYFLITIPITLFSSTQIPPSQRQQELKRIAYLRGEKTFQELVKKLRAKQNLPVGFKKQ